MKPTPAHEPATWTPPEQRGTGTGIWAAPENITLCLALALMMLIPLVEASMRATLPFGISGAASLVQHLVLVVGMVGGAVAARQTPPARRCHGSSHVGPAVRHCMGLV